MRKVTDHPCRAPIVSSFRARRRSQLISCHPVSNRTARSDAGMNRPWYRASRSREVERTLATEEGIQDVGSCAHGDDDHDDMPDDSFRRRISSMCRERGMRGSRTRGSPARAKKSFCGRNQTSSTSRRFAGPPPWISKAPDPARARSTRTRKRYLATFTRHRRNFAHAIHARQSADRIPRAHFIRWTNEESPA